MDTYVNFESAKLLKEKNFNKRSGLYNYNNIGELTLLEGLNAPTITEVVMWLYEKHDIWTSIEQNTYEDKFDYLITQRNEDSSWFVVGNDEKIIKSPAEAYTEAIRYTLNNLI